MILELEVLGYAAGGNCVARHEGKVIFIRGVIPGETVRVKLNDDEKSKRFTTATLVEVITPAVKRVTPPCQHFGECGGCDWQHISIDEQMNMHHIVISDQLKRIGKFGNLTVLPTLSVEGETGLGYRNKMRFATSDAGNFAMRKNKSHNLVEIDSCLIADAQIDAVTKSNWPPAAEVTVVKGSDEVLVLANREIVPEITYRNDFGSWQVPAGDFWQVHQQAPVMLIERVLHQLEISQGDRVADLYAGVGLFAQPIAKLVGSSGAVFSVENDLRAHRCALANLHSFDWAEVIQSDVAKYLRKATGFNKAIVDPPRSGLNQSVINSLNQVKGLTKICYVSCDAGTLARDLRSFADTGWQIGEIQPLLLFPMTAHIETIVSVTKLS